MREPWSQGSSPEGDFLLPPILPRACIQQMGTEFHSYGPWTITVLLPILRVRLTPSQNREKEKVESRAHERCGRHGVTRRCRRSSVMWGGRAGARQGRSLGWGIPPFPAKGLAGPYPSGFSQPAPALQVWNWVLDPDWANLKSWVFPEAEGEGLFQLPAPRRVRDCSQFPHRGV